MRFGLSIILFLAAAIAFFTQIEWLFLTLAVFAAVVLVAEAGSPAQALPRELAREERAEARESQTQQVVMLQQPSLGREIYDKIVTEVVTGIFEKKEINNIKGEINSIKKKLE